MTLHEASRAQIAAAAPDASTWLSANAGSGKTRVLIDRVARLLLDGARPERILCLTYTKAAASEMQNRLFQRLGAWAMANDKTLAAELAGMGVEAGGDPEMLARARRLFARAIETPGGLKIQTIHSFCSVILRRFPLEAGVSPGFTEAEERAQLVLIDEVLDRIAEQGGEAALGAAADEIGGTDMRDLARAVLSVRERFHPPATEAEIFGWYGIDPSLDEAVLIGRVFTGDEEALCRKLLPALNPKNAPHKAACRILPGFPWSAPDLDDLAAMEDALLSGASAKEPDQPKPGIFGNKTVAAAMGEDLDTLAAFAERLQEARPLRRALLGARRTVALHRFADAFLPAYADAMEVRGWLDFDDLIHKTRALLTTPGAAQWVLFRLDGGIDHMLVDEAQDTSPDQWEIVKTLAEEFASGLGARDDVLRTIFVVGDRKQSIYSFQGADPDGFDRMARHFEERLGATGARFRKGELLYSFRSAPPILRLVDRVCEGAASAGVGAEVRHKAFKSELPGRVDIWPAIPAPDKVEEGVWYDPVDLPSDTHQNVRLARTVARRIGEMLENPPLIGAGQDRRPLTAGDILILVQRRSPLFHRIISEIKAAGLPIVGADRMDLTGQLGVKDLVGLLSFLATPEDDLSLAAVLRSPLFGITEDALFRLAHDRRGSLWRELRNSAEHAGITEVLGDLRNHADFLRPFELIDRILTRHRGRERLLARLGTEAADGIDALLAQALAYERSEVPSLTGFLEWLAVDKLQVRRDPNGGVNEIRIMTVHGAKGLEAPVVILPDTARRQGNPDRGPKVLVPGDGPPVWAKSANDAAEAERALLDARSQSAREEQDRLLYVAMTRAECWLIVAAAGDLGKDESASWYNAIRAAAEAEGAAPLPFEDGEGLRIETGDWPRAEGETGTTALPRAELPDWALREARTERRDMTVLSPSDLGGAKALPGEFGGLPEAEAMARGSRLHLLLEHLPRIARPGWNTAAPGILAMGSAGEGADTEDLLAEATAVLTAPDLAPLFDPDALAEVALVADSPTLGAPLSGQIDRLIVSEDRVLAVDFKSNAVVPESPAEVPEGLLRQMGAYAEMLAAIYPERRIETAILWTRKARLMRLPHADVMAALRRAAIA